MYPPANTPRVLFEVHVGTDSLVKPSAKNTAFPSDAIVMLSTPCPAVALPPVFQNKPLIEFTDAFESGLVNAGDYINGELVDSAINTSNLDASTYGPDTAQDTVIDAGLYLNVES